MDNYSHCAKTHKSLISNVFSVMKHGTTKKIPKIKINPTKITSVCNGKIRVITKNVDKKSENFKNIQNNYVDSNQVINYILIVLLLLLLFMFFKKKY